jgi:FtsP/CotA-like multicopper oxidase with cupredoxin domain
MMSEIDTTWHHDSIINHPHDTTATTHMILDYEPQHFLINGKSEQQLDNTVEIIASVGEVVYLRLANIGYYGTRLIFPPAVDPQTVSSDGRPLPNVPNSDTIEVLPGERYGVLLNCGINYTGVATIEYFDLNTGIVENTQSVLVQIDGFLDNQEPILEEVRMYPNPASNELIIEMPEGISSEVFVSIENMLGQRVLAQNVFGTPINVASLENGNYIVRIRSNGKEWNRKLIIRNE